MKTLVHQLAPAALEKGDRPPREALVCVKCGALFVRSESVGGFDEPPFEFLDKIRAGRPDVHSREDYFE
jgi:hypothetical protein